VLLVDRLLEVQGGLVMAFLTGRTSSLDSLLVERTNGEKLLVVVLERFHFVDYQGCLDHFAQYYHPVLVDERDRS
jgi:hypothetical protein